MKHSSTIAEVQLTWLMTGANSVGPESCTHFKLSLLRCDGRNKVRKSVIAPPPKKKSRIGQIHTYRDRSSEHGAKVGWN